MLLKIEETKMKMKKEEGEEGEEGKKKKLKTKEQLHISLN